MEQLRDAYSSPEPTIAAASLVHLVKQQPTAETVAWLAELYESLAAHSPSRADTLAQSLVLLRDSADIPTIAKNDPSGKPYEESFAVVLNLFLHEVISSAISGPSSDLIAIAPTNAFLVGSVISAAARKHGLYTSSAQIGAVARGIHFPESNYQLYTSPDAREVSSLGACLQLLIAGTSLCEDGQIGRSREHLLPSIKSLLTDETIKDANGKKLLEVGVISVFSAFWLLIDLSSRSRRNMQRMDLRLNFPAERLGIFYFLLIVEKFRIHVIRCNFIFIATR
jgi:hypothetical protein